MATEFNTGLEVPLVVIAYNRPQKLEQLWRIVAKQRPKKLYLISDGPKTERDIPLVEACRSLAIPDWSCTFTKLFSDVNMGCSATQINGLSRVFAKEEAAIILEDDCLPVETFFPYCLRMLNLFAEDLTIFSIAGTNHADTGDSRNILFSRYFWPWGWATWRRSWMSCDWAKIWTEEDLDALTDYTVNSWVRRFWQKRITRPDQPGQLESWDYTFCLTGLVTRKITVVPPVNQIENQGFDQDATHTKKQLHKLPPARALLSSVCVPECTDPSNSYDDLMERRHYDGRILSLLRQKLAIRTRLRNLLQSGDPRLN